MQLFDVQGMSCEHCVHAVTGSIQAVDPEARVRVDLEAGRVTVENESAPEDVLLEAIAREGYDAVPAAA